jgi:hypothetical protein
VSRSGADSRKQRRGHSYSLREPFYRRNFVRQLPSTVSTAIHILVRHLNVELLSRISDRFEELTRSYCVLTALSRRLLCFNYWVFYQGLFSYQAAASCLEYVRPYQFMVRHLLLTTLLNVPLQINRYRIQSTHPLWEHALAFLPQTPDQLADSRAAWRSAHHAHPSSPW